MQNGTRGEVVPRSPSAHSPLPPYRPHISSSPALSRGHRSPPPRGPMPTAYGPPQRERPQGTFFDPTREERGRGSAVTSPAPRPRSPVMVWEDKAASFYLTLLIDVFWQESPRGIERKSLDRGYTSPVKVHSRPTSSYSYSPRQGITSQAISFQPSSESRHTMNQTMAPPSHSSAAPSEPQPLSVVR